MSKLLCALAFAMLCGVAHADTLICEGDSQTAARPPLVDSQTWCAIVAARLGWAHVNDAVGGSKAADVIARLPTDLAGPGSCVAVMIGANDAFIDPATYNAQASQAPEWTSPVYPPGTTPLSDFDAELVNIVTTIRAAGKTPLLLTPWAMFSSAELTQFPFYQRKIQDVGQRLGVPVIDAYELQPRLWWNLRTALFADYEQDYQHPNAAGHAAIAALFNQERYSSACAYAP